MKGAASLNLFSARKHRSEGDAARDRKSWKEAEIAYRTHLQACPDDIDIWVQLGHALKEQQRLNEAEEAYRNAFTLRPDDSDSSLHLAHLLKRSGRVSEAAEMFAVSFRSLPSSEAYDELMRLRGAVPVPSNKEDLAADTVFIEIDDLFRYLEAHKTLSGIQRVQVAIIQHVLACRGRDKTNVFVFNSDDAGSTALSGAGCVWHLRDADLQELVGYVTGAQVDHDHLRRLIERAKNNASLVTPRTGQSYLVLGAFWGNVEAIRRYLTFKRSGILLGCYIYDLIPITYPEYCDANLSHDFALSFADAMALFDYVLTISAYTAREVIRYREKSGLSPIPVIAVPLAHTQSDNASPQRAGWTPKIARLKNRPFVLMVSTIEARKNHAYLVAAWKQFLDEGLEPPDLVFVGRVGWHVSSLMEMLELTRYLNGRIVILHDLSDVELQTLYIACLFTAFPSFVEGWGLPVGESLACGRPCVASSTSSIPEVGGDLADYLDPHNLRDGLEVLRKMTFDHAYRARRERAIAAQFVVRRWRDVGADLLEQIGRLKSSFTPDPEFRVRFAAGAVFRVSDLAPKHILPPDYSHSPKRLMLTPFCYSIENHGCWIQGSHGVLTFQSNLPAYTEIIFYAALCGAPWAASQHWITVNIEMNGERCASTANHVRRPVPAHGRFAIRCFGRVGENGDVSVHLTVEGEVPVQPDAADKRRFIAGIVAFGYAARDNLIARADISEALAFDLA